MYRWDGAQDRYQMYYIRTSDNWTFLVIIPRSVITQDATTLFYVQLLFQGLFLLIIIYLCLRNYYTLRQNRRCSAAWKRWAKRTTAWYRWMPCATGAMCSNCPAA